MPSSQVPGLMDSELDWEFNSKAPLSATYFHYKLVFDQTHSQMAQTDIKVLCTHNHWSSSARMPCREAGLLPPGYPAPLGLCIPPASLGHPVMGWDLSWRGKKIPKDSNGRLEPPLGKCHVGSRSSRLSAFTVRVAPARATASQWKPQHPQQHVHYSILRRGNHSLFNKA